MLLNRAGNMRVNGRVEEDLDEYEDEYGDEYADEYGDEYAGEEEEEEEVQQDEPLSEEAMKYLGLRQKLKEQMRSKLRRENGVRLNNSKDQLRAAPLEKFGSFFGPSKPVIAERVIQESKSLLETKHLAAKASTSHSDGKKVPVPSSSGTKNGVMNKPPPPPVKSKAQIIKATRDYSFLLSDDAELPKPSKDPGPLKSSTPKPDSRSAQVPAKSSRPSSHPGERRMNGHEQRNCHDRSERRMNGHEQRNGHDQRRPSSGVVHARPVQTSAPQKLNYGNNKGNISSESREQVDWRKQPQPNKHLGTSNGNGPARPTGPIRPPAPKVLPPKKPLPSSERRAPAGPAEKRLPAGSVDRKVPGASRNKTLAPPKNSAINGQQMVVVKSHMSVLNNRLEHKPNVQRNNESKILKKVNAADPRNQMARPQKQDPYRASSQNDAYIKKPKPAGPSSLQRPGATSKEQDNRKRRAEEAFSDEEGFDYRSEIRRMFGRPTQYHDDYDDEDDDCMEVGFDTIQIEERRSAKIAKKEDDEELIKIMEEERQERLRKQAKMRKMSHR